MAHTTTTTTTTTATATATTTRYTKCTNERQKKRCGVDGCSMTSHAKTPYAHLVNHWLASAKCIHGELGDAQRHCLTRHNAQILARPFEELRRRCFQVLICITLLCSRFLLVLCLPVCDQLLHTHHLHTRAARRVGKNLHCLTKCRTGPSTLLPFMQRRECRLHTLSSIHDQ